MKSIIQQASSISKAIDQAWQKAEKPDSFSIKIFESPTYNFLGFNRTPAKIGIFFEAIKAKPTKRPAPKRFVQKKQSAQQKPLTQTPKKTITPQKDQAPRSSKGEFWTEEILNESTKWLNGALKVMSHSSSRFDLTAKDHLLRITFQEPVFADERKEQQLFRSFAILLLQTLRNQFRRPLRGFKIHISRR